jgi:hypothetical protein
MRIEEYIRYPHVLAAFNDMVLRGVAELVLRDDGALLMIIQGNPTEEVVFEVVPTGLRCLARLERPRCQASD